VQVQVQARIEKLVQPPHAVAEKEQQEQQEMKYIKDQKLHQPLVEVFSKFYL
jgi:hypothetical protein